MVVSEAILVDQWETQWLFNATLAIYHKNQLVQFVKGTEARIQILLIISVEVGGWIEL